MKKYILLMLIPAIFTACNNNAAQEKRDNDKATYAIGMSQVVGIGKVSPENDIIQLSSPVNGIVAKIYIKENDSVLAGSLILALEHRLEDVNLIQLTRKIQTQTAQIKVDQATVIEQETKVFNATEQLRHLQNLLLKGAETQQTVDDATTNLASLNANLNRLEANVNVSKSRLQESKTALKTAQVERGQKFIRSPIKGKVLALSVLLGGSVSIQQSFAQISPVGNTIAICEIYSSALDRLKDYGTLKAIGAGNKYISKLILTQAMLLTIVGFLIGLALLEGFRLGVAKSGLTFSFSPLMLLAMFSTIGLISLGGASFALSRIKSVEPAAVFR